MPDVIFERFVASAAAEAAELCGRSDVLRVYADRGYAGTFACSFAVPYLRLRPGGAVAPHPGPVHAVVHFPPDYLRSIDPHLYLHVAAVLTPDIVHPNIRGTAICLGSAFRSGTRLGIILRELFEIFSYVNFSLSENDSLNPMACRLLRAHTHLLQSLEARPLVRRNVRLRIKVGPR